MTTDAIAESTRLREELIERARREGKWIHLQYQNIWFKPDELTRANAGGSWRLHPMNFTLRDPQEEFDRLVAACAACAAEVAAFEKRMRDAQ